MPVVHFRHETLGLLSPVAGRQGSDLAPHSLYGWVELVRGPISRSSTLGDYLRRHDLDCTGPALVGGFVTRRRGTFVHREGCQSGQPKGGAVMARIAKVPDRDVSADPPENADIENLMRTLDQSEVAELFDATARLRFGQIISATATKPANKARHH